MSIITLDEDKVKELIRASIAASELIDAIRKMDARKQYKEAEAKGGIPDIAFKLQDLHIELDSLKSEMRDIAEEEGLDFPEEEEE